MVIPPKNEWLTFYFILPIPTRILAKVNTINMPSTITDAQGFQWERGVSDWRINGYGSEVFGVYNASFPAQIIEGKNTIHIEYTQPVSIQEVDYGFFKKGRFIEGFMYILAPLKQWKLADNFTLDITVSTLKKRPERSSWSFFKNGA